MRVEAGRLVPMSMNTLPGRPASSMPPGPRTAVSTSVELGRHAMTTEQSATKDASDGAIRAPSASSAWAGSGRRCAIVVTSKPLRTRFAAMG